MPSALDLRMDAAMAGLVAEGGMMPVVEVEHRGRHWPAIAAAPPALSYYFAHFCAEHADKEFLVAGEERLERLVGETGEAQVADFDDAVGGDEDVGGFEVAVDDVAMSILLRVVVDGKEKSQVNTGCRGLPQITLLG